MEMESKIAKKDRHGLWKWACLKSQRSFTAAETMERLYNGRVISQEEEEEEEEEEKGVVRVKIVVSKQELRQMVASMSQRNSSAAQAAAPGLEQLLQVLTKRSMKVANTPAGQRGDWRPALQSIPEEIC